jgi:hypothetical protein
MPIGPASICAVSRITMEVKALFLRLTTAMIKPSPSGAV